MPWRPGAGVARARTWRRGGRAYPRPRRAAPRTGRPPRPTARHEDERRTGHARCASGCARQRTARQALPRGPVAHDAPRDTRLARELWCGRNFSWHVGGGEESLLVMSHFNDSLKGRKAGEGNPSGKRPVFYKQQKGREGAPAASRSPVSRRHALCPPSRARTRAG